MGLDMCVQIREVESHGVVKEYNYRKFNALHGLMLRLGYEHEFFDAWDEVDNALLLGKDEIEEITDILSAVLFDKTQAEYILPIEKGFFFGSYEYDDYYFQCVEQALADFKEIQEKYTSDRFEILYDASW